MQIELEQFNPEVEMKESICKFCKHFSYDEKQNMLCAFTSPPLEECAILTEKFNLLP